MFWPCAAALSARRTGWPSFSCQRMHAQICIFKQPPAALSCRFMSEGSVALVNVWSRQMVSRTVCRVGRVCSQFRVGWFSFDEDTRFFTARPLVRLGHHLLRRACIAACVRTGPVCKYVPVSRQDSENPHRIQVVAVGDGRRGCRGGDIQFVSRHAADLRRLLTAFQQSLAKGMQCSLCHMSFALCNQSRCQVNEVSTHQGYHLVASMTGARFPLQ